MKRRFAVRPPSLSMAVALTALFVALGGTSYAAFTLPANSVGTKQLRKWSVTTKKIKPGSVTDSRIAAGTITGDKINLGTLGTVPSANTANTAANATNATNATNANHAGSADNATGAASPTNLASGKTETGHFAASGVASAGGQRAEGAISFPFPMATAPTPQIIGPGGSSTAQCPGSWANPQAAAGNLCLYESQNTNVPAGGECVYTGLSGCGVATKYGGVLYVPSNGSGEFYIEGTWAATAS